MNERVKLIRKVLNLNQACFGSRLGVTPTAISKIESGDRSLTEQMILAICNVFSVDENWLRLGSGDMFKAVPSDELEKLAAHYQLSGMAKRFVKTFIELDQEEQNRILFFMVKVVMDGAIDINAPKVIDTDKWEDETERAQAIIDAQRELYRIHNKGNKKGNYPLALRADDTPAQAAASAPALTLEQEADAAAAAYREQFLLQKKQASQAYTSTGSNTG